MPKLQLTTLHDAVVDDMEKICAQLSSKLRIHLSQDLWDELRRDIALELEYKLWDERYLE